MMDWIQTYEPALRLGAFAGVLLVLLVAQHLWPRRSLDGLARMGINLGIAVVNTLVLRLCFPVLAVGTAVWAGEREWGLFNQLPVINLLEVVLAVILLDMIIYWQHRLMHAVPVLWRLHRMHHSDLAFDVTTGVRFHPLEMVLSMLIKMAAVVLLGAAPVAVILFEVLLSITSLFEHANLRLPAGLDRALRILIVTPDMHRVHHSVYRDETDSNFGFNLSVWDRWFASYRPQPRDGHTGMQIGLREFRQTSDQSMLGLLRQPFVSAGQ